MVQFIVDFNQTYVFEYDNINEIVIENIKKQLSRIENISYDLISIQYNNYENNTHHNDDFDDDDDGVDDEYNGECASSIIFLKASLVGGIKGGKGGNDMLYILVYCIFQKLIIIINF